MQPNLKKTILLSGLCFFFSLTFLAQDSIATQKTAKRWYVVLPLRFTQLQSKNTMLSGIKVGKEINPHFAVALSIYHSFYLKSFKSEANLPGYKEQPRVFINGMGFELQYTFYNSKRVGANIQLLTGWGFIKYDLKAYNFSSKQVNFILLEPALNLEYKITPFTSLELGLGYRPILTTQNINYKSAISQGNIPVHKSFPNGLNVVFCLKGYL